MKKIQIVGAGISGLLCAYFASEKGYEVEVCDVAPVPGGKIHTRMGTYGMMETAANAILADELVEQVAEKIGLNLIKKKSTANKRFIFINGQVSRWPLSLMDTLRFIQFLVMWKIGSSSVQPNAHETLSAWCKRVMSSTIAERLLGPACQGIFGVETSSLSASLVFHYFFSSKTKVYGKLRGSVAPQKGMGEWIDCLMSYLKEKNVKFTFGNEPRLDTNHEVIMATDLKNAVSLLNNQEDPRGQILSTVPQVSLVSVNVFYKNRPRLQQPGFGILFPRSEGIEALGVLLNSDIFAERTKDSFSETWIFGSREKKYTEFPDDHFLKLIQAMRHKIWEDSQSPLEMRVNRWPEAIPLYGLELEKALLQLSLHPSSQQIHLMGNYLGEIGLNRLFHRAKSLLETI